LSKIQVSLKRLAMLFLCVVALLCGLFIYLFLEGHPPKEKALIERFYAHRAAYEALRDMLLADQQVCAVWVRSGVETRKSGSPCMPSQRNLPAGRYNEYLVLLEQIGSAGVFRAGGSDSEICMTVWAAGFGGDTRQVENCWLDHTPSNQVGSLDDFYKTPKPRRPVFRHIDANWYLWADW